MVKLATNCLENKEASTSSKKTWEQGRDGNCRKELALLAYPGGLEDGVDHRELAKFIAWRVGGGGEEMERAAVPDSVYLCLKPSWSSLIERGSGVCVCTHSCGVDICTRQLQPPNFSKLLKMVGRTEEATDKAGRGVEGTCRQCQDWINSFGNLHNRPCDRIKKRLCIPLLFRGS